ncbi:hypothetical protein C8R45DRAFT_938555 [Mycena sanguinolenta]|nr:hypothetical protein C8R45DRAFT_938555 [Mycena sanguinolenta]
MSSFGPPPRSSSFGGSAVRPPPAALRATKTGDWNPFRQQRENATTAAVQANLQTYGAAVAKKPLNKAGNAYGVAYVAGQASTARYNTSVPPPVPKSSPTERQRIGNARTHGTFSMYGKNDVPKAPNARYPMGNCAEARTLAALVNQAKLTRKPTRIVSHCKAKKKNSDLPFCANCQQYATTVMRDYPWVTIVDGAAVEKRPF